MKPLVTLHTPAHLVRRVVQLQRKLCGSGEESLDGHDHVAVNERLITPAVFGGVAFSMDNTHLFDECALP